MAAKEAGEQDKLALFEQWALSHIAVEQRLRVALVAEHTPTLSWRERLSAFLPWPRLAFGLAVAGLLIVVRLPRLFSRDRDLVWFTQAVALYQAATEGRLPLTYHLNDPQELEKAFNSSGQLDFVTHVLDLRRVGYSIEDGQIVRIQGQPVALVLYKGEDGPIICLRQRGVVPPIPKDSEAREGMYLYTHAGYTISLVQFPDHFCMIVTRLPREAFMRRFLTATG